MLTISCYGMKRSLANMRDDEIGKYLADMVHESLLIAKNQCAENMQNFFYPEKSIPEKQQKNAQHHVDTVLSVLNEQYGTHLRRDFVLSFMREPWYKDGERITRFMQYVVQESYCFTRSDNKRKAEIYKILESIENDVQTKHYILTGISTRVTRAVIAFWHDDMQDAFNVVQKYQEEQQKTCGLRVLSPATH